MADEALNVFISYSHRDEGLKDEWVNYHLKLLLREGKVSTWQDRQIEAGAEWAIEIKTNLEKADMVLLLITRHFLASDYCCETEMQRAVQRHHEGTARVIPIILETCGWQYSPFQKLQVLPKDGKPITRWPDRAEAFFDVEQGLRQVVHSLNAQREAEKLKRQQEETDRLEREKQEQERLAAEQHWLMQAETQRWKQENRQKDLLSAEQKETEYQGSEERIEGTEQPSQDEGIPASEIFIDRRKVLWWLVGSLGWVIALISTTSRFFRPALRPTIHKDDLLLSATEKSGTDISEEKSGSEIDDSNGSPDKKSKHAFNFGWLDMLALVLIPALIFGPKRLPDVGRSLGQAIKGFQDASREFEEEFKKEAARVEAEAVERKEEEN